MNCRTFSRTPRTRGGKSHHHLRHLHFWQNDWGLSRATAVTRESGTDTKSVSSLVGALSPSHPQRITSGLRCQNKGQQRKSALERKRLLSGIKPASFQSQVWCSTTKFGLCLWWWLFPHVRGAWENVRQFIPRLHFNFFKFIF